MEAATVSLITKLFTVLAVVLEQKGIVTRKELGTIVLNIADRGAEDSEEAAILRGLGQSCMSAQQSTN